MDYWRRFAGRLLRRGPPRFLGVSPQTPGPLRVPLLPLAVIINLQQILWRATIESLDERTSPCQKRRLGVWVGSRVSGWQPRRVVAKNRSRNATEHFH